MLSGAQVTETSSEARRANAENQRKVKDQVALATRCVPGNVGYANNPIGAENRRLRFRFRLVHSRTMKTFRLRSLNLLPFIFGAVSIGCLAQVSSPSPQHLFFRVTLGAQQTTPVSGRLLLLIKPGTKLEDVQVNEFHPASISIAAKDVSGGSRANPSISTPTTLRFPLASPSCQPGDYRGASATRHGQ